MRKLIMLLFALGVVVTFVATSLAQTRTARTLDIYVIDVEGGGSVLFVAPSGESVLVDSGNDGAAAVRDADRIMAAVKDAGITQIGTLITTHWHADHYGAMAELAGRIPIRNFIDHGPNVQPASVAEEFLKNVYPEVYGKGKRSIARPGDRVPVNGLDWRIVTSAKDAITTPLPGAGDPNPYCANFKPMDNVGGIENPESIGSVVTFGKFRAAYMGDLTANQEFKLMCPVNRVGNVDVFVVSHHSQPTANAEVLSHAIRPRVAISNNGTRKGGQPDAMKLIYSAPGLEDLWQLHFSLLSGQEYTAPGIFIANTVDEPQTAMPLAPMPASPPGTAAPAAPVHNGPAYWIKVSAQSDGAFTVTNSRNGFTKSYAAVAR